MIYAIIAAGIAGLLMFGTIKVQHANNVSLQTRATTAEGANKALAEDCAAKIKRANDQIADIAKQDAARAKRARDAKAAADKAAKAQQPKVDALAAQAASPAAATEQAQCETATAILSDVAKARAP